MSGKTPDDHQYVQAVRMAGKRKAWHSGSYASRAAAIRAAAYRNPSTRCWTCGLTLDEVRRNKPQATWDAGHVEDAKVNGPLKAQCSPCNRSAGAIKRNEADVSPTSRQW